MSKNKQREISAYEEGRKAFRDDDYNYWNPYHKKFAVRLRSAFRNGWLDAFKEKLNKDHSFAMHRLINVDFDNPTDLIYWKAIPLSVREGKILRGELKAKILEIQ